MSFVLYISLSEGSRECFPSAGFNVFALCSVTLKVSACLLCTGTSPGSRQVDGGLLLVFPLQGKLSSLRPPFAEGFYRHPFSGLGCSFSS